MQSDYINEKIFCRLCLNIINYTDAEGIENAKEVLEAVLPNLNLEERYQDQMCKACCSKLFSAFAFKTTCMTTEDIILPYINAGNVSAIDLKEVYLKMKGNIQLTDKWENQHICRLCLQLVTYGCMSLNEVDSDIIDTYIPQVNTSGIKDPVICGLCFDSLCTYGGFVKNCIEVQKKHKSVNKPPYIKTELTEIKLERDDAQEAYKNIDKPDYIKLEEIYMELQDGQDPQEELEDIDKPSYIRFEEIDIKLENNRDAQLEYENIDKPSYVKSEDMDIQEGRQVNGDHESNCTGIKRNNISSHQSKHEASQIQTYKCNTCSFETKRKSSFTIHLQGHKIPLELQFHRCDTCDFKCKRRDTFKQHQLKHKSGFEVQMYCCSKCDFKTKYKRNLSNHLLIHKDPSEVPMYKCDVCSFETKQKSSLKIHMQQHKDRAELQLYVCDTCDFKTNLKNSLTQHRQRHKRFDPQKYKCDKCDFKTKYKYCLLNHEFTHPYSYEVQKYKCDTCSFESSRRGSFKVHLKTHKDLSETSTKTQKDFESITL